MVRYVPEVRSKLCTVNLVVKHTQIVYGESVPKSYQAETMNLIAIWWKIGYNSAKNSVFDITWVPHARDLVHLPAGMWKGIYDFF